MLSWGTSGPLEEALGHYFGEKKRGIWMIRNDSRGRDSLSVVQPPGAGVIAVRYGGPPLGAQTSRHLPGALEGCDPWRNSWTRILFPAVRICPAQTEQDPYDEVSKFS